MNLHFFYRFFVVLITALLLSFVAHYFILNYLDNSFEISLLLYTYLAITAMTSLIVLAIYKLQKKYFNMVGFMFLAGSFLKFGIYFVFLKPFYQQYELPKTKAFLVFFIPYVISLIIEAIYVSKLLNKPSKSP